MRILISGGAGFVGAQMARLFREKYPQAEIVAFDNLRRRGSEMNLPLLRQRNVTFVHGDLRAPEDLNDLDGSFDLFIEASAEPSVLAGMGGSSPVYAVQTNLVGTTHCLEFARKRCGLLLFLSTSRVYSIPALKELPLTEGPTRFDIEQPANGIDENFPTSGYRSIYGATKLASELLIQEYAHAYGTRALINRCGVIAGPGQFGKADQGVFTLWLARHYFKQPLKYTGFGGTGKQVRDLLHPVDLFELIVRQMAKPEHWTSDVYNVGGGRPGSTSLLEWTGICQEATGNKVDVTQERDSASVDVPYYVSDFRKAAKAFDWRPEHSLQRIASDTVAWIKENENQLKGMFK